jgi:hypothetical protein
MFWIGFNPQQLRVIDDPADDQLAGELFPKMKCNWNYRINNCR